MTPNNVPRRCRTRRFSFACLEGTRKKDAHEVAGITIASCLRKLLPTDLREHLRKMSHMVLYCDVKKFVINQVGVPMIHGDKHLECNTQGPTFQKLQSTANESQRNLREGSLLSTVQKTVDFPERSNDKIQ